MKWLNTILAAMFLAMFLTVAVAGAEPAGAPPPPMRLARHLRVPPLRRGYPGALTSLIAAVNGRSSLSLDPQPFLLESLSGPELFRHPFVYVNFADRQDWTFSEEERRDLRGYLERGGFLFVDAGINAEFLRGDGNFGQHHSFAEWQVSPELAAAFKQIFPELEFQPLPRSHQIFRSFHSGLPDPSRLPDEVRDYVVGEKWPDGTYSSMGLSVNGRLAVLATPIIAMGWARGQLGDWVTTIKFRVREGAADMGARLATAAYSGERFEAVREDGRRDLVFCQEHALPAWVREPDGRWRVFRYYHSSEINDYAHVFYTQLGVNIIVHSLTN